MSSKDNKRLSTVIAIIMLLLGALLFISPRFTSEKDMSSIVPAQNIEQSIDRNLKAADIRRQLETLKIKIQNERAERIKAYDLGPANSESGHLKTNQESHAEQVMEEIEEYERRGDDAVLDPSEVVERRIARDQALAEYDKKYKKEYIKAFLQNARDQGIEVELNDDLEVIGIRELPSDEPMRFPNSVPGSGGAAQ